MIYIVVAVLMISLLLYVLLAGADFGAGILELFSRKKSQLEERQVIYKAIGPVWEANHIWLILVVVILFVGFPKIYAVISTYLHLPVLLLLIGIILRGSSFAFRHHDAIIDRSQNFYTGIFILSSIWSPLFLGIIAGSLTLGRISLTFDGSFYELYVKPWFNLFSLSVGIFTCCIFAFLAAVYLIGEAKVGDIKKIFINNAFVANIATVVAGALVFATAEIYDLHLLQIFFNNPIAIGAVIAATLALPFLWIFLKRENIILQRMLAGFQILMILIAWFSIKFPSIIFIKNGEHLTIYNTAAPDSTIYGLGIALIFGASLIFPAFFYLLRIFKMRQAD